MLPVRKKVLILGAAGRDFHDFNVVFRSDPEVEVVAFTAAQIPNIAGRSYPPELAGELYPQGVPIWPESELERLVAEHGIDEVVFSYSDVSHEDVMHHASRVLGSGAGFRLLAPRATMLRSKKPVVSVCAVRTGAGKSPATRRIAELLCSLGTTVAIVRHPMPYGDLSKQVVQRFASRQDIDRAECTLEEREEYEPHVDAGHVVFAGVDYARVLAAAEAEAEVIVWDGGNNDYPFFVPDLEVVLVDPHRAGDETRYHPGETNLRRAHVVLINKIDTALGRDVEAVRRSVRALNPRATVIETDLEITMDRPELLRDARALVIEDGPTTTHGGMSYGAGTIAARRAGARELVDPRPFARGSLRETFRSFPHLTHVLPAMGYGREQLAELRATIAAVDCDVVVIATPIDLGRVLELEQPSVRVRYRLVERGEPALERVLRPVLERIQS
jgi:predicted GTPase